MSDTNSFRQGTVAHGFSFGKEDYDSMSLVIDTLALQDQIKSYSVSKLPAKLHS